MQQIVAARTLEAARLGDLPALDTTGKDSPRRPTDNWSTGEPATPPVSPNRVNLHGLKGGRFARLQQ